MIIDVQESCQCSMRRNMSATLGACDHPLAASGVRCGQVLFPPACPLRQDVVLVRIAPSQRKVLRGR